MLPKKYPSTIAINKYDQIDGKKKHLLHVIFRAISSKLEVISARLCKKRTKTSSLPHSSIMFEFFDRDSKKTVPKINKIKTPAKKQENIN